MSPSSLELNSDEFCFFWDLSLEFWKRRYHLIIIIVKPGKEKEEAKGTFVFLHLDAVVIVYFE